YEQSAGREQIDEPGPGLARPRRPVEADQEHRRRTSRQRADDRGENDPLEQVAPDAHLLTRMPVKRHPFLQEARRPSRLRLTREAGERLSEESRRPHLTI